ncbi:MAG: hypothetical protein AB8G15_15250 [Saprospiraceae bacterium]
METKAPWYQSPYRKAVLLAISIFLVIVLYTIEFDFLSKTFEVFRMMIIALGIGAVVGIYFGNRFKEQGKNLEEKIVFFALSFFICLVVVPLLFSMTNRLLSFHAAKMEPLEFISSKAFGMKRFGVRKENMMDVDGYHLFFLRDGKVERIKSEQELFPGAVSGDPIQLPIKQGLFGFYFVALNAQN